MEKCDLCLDRMGEGKKPLCVATCPLRALDAGPLEEMEKTTGGVRQAPAFRASATPGPPSFSAPEHGTARRTLR
jgi:anaerobic dimethyl sulfoxide reductase subunit B (iron-sulfur subunit)